MPDESTTTSGEATQSTTDQHDGDDDEGDPQQDAAKLFETLRKERAARKALEKEVKPLRTFKQTAEDAAKTDQERRDERIAELEGQLTAAQQKERSYALRDAIESTMHSGAFGFALKAPINDLLHFVPADLDPSNNRAVTAALTELTKSRAYMFEVRRGPSGDGGPGRDALAAHGMNDMIRASRGR